MKVTWKLEIALKYHYYMDTELINIPSTSVNFK